MYGMTTSRDNNMHNLKTPKLVATHEQMIKNKASKESKELKQKKTKTKKKKEKEVQGRGAH